MPRDVRRRKSICNQPYLNENSAGVQGGGEWHEGRGDTAKTTPFVPQGRATRDISATKTDFAALLEVHTPDLTSG